MRSVNYSIIITLVSLVSLAHSSHQDKVYIRFLRPGQLAWRRPAAAKEALSCYHYQRRFGDGASESWSIAPMYDRTAPSITMTRCYTAAAAAAAAASSIKGRGRKAATEEEAEALEWSGKSPEELQAISSYFPDMKDNSTLFFYSPQDYESFGEALAAALPNITLERANNLHEIGAIYVHREGKFRRSHRLEALGFVGDSKVVKGDLIRVYLYPRRFASCFADYRPRIRYEDDDMVIIDKPAGCPCSLHVSNAVEALDITASASLGIPLIRMNRLDTVTTGLVTLGKTKHGASVWWEEIRKDRVKKVYKALVLGPLPLGLLEHYMPGKIIHRRPAPRAINESPLPGWKICQCRILSCTPLTLPALDSDHPDKVYYEVEAELITGRTHQLRAQFSAMGSPILYDTMYIPLSSFLLKDEDDPAIQALYPLCEEPQSPTGIGLQCSTLTFLCKTVTAGEPWWRTLGDRNKVKEDNECV